MWSRNEIQFPRLLAELNAVGLTRRQWQQLSESMDLAFEDIDELFSRAEDEWGRIKEGRPPKRNR